MFFMKFLFLQIIEELRANDVQIYEFPTDDETVADLNAKMNVSKPMRLLCQGSFD